MAKKIAKERMAQKKNKTEVKEAVPPKQVFKAVSSLPVTSVNQSAALE